MQLSKEEFDALCVGTELCVSVACGINQWRNYHYRNDFTVKRTITRITPKRTQATLNDGSTVKFRESSWGGSTSYFIEFKKLPPTNYHFLSCHVQSLWTNSDVDQTEEINAWIARCVKIFNNRTLDIDVLTVDDIDKAENIAEHISKIKTMMKEAKNASK